MPFINLNKVTDIAEEASKLNFTELLELQNTINRMVNKQTREQIGKHQEANAKEAEERMKAWRDHFY